MATNNNEQNRTTVISLLNARLADAIDLVYQAKQAHWNVSGPGFYALHELFEKIADDLREHVDDIAERVAQLGGQAEGTIKMAAEHSSLPDFPANLAGGSAYVEVLAKALDACATNMREAIDQASDLGDEVTVDIFVGATRAIDKLAWMVRAHGVEQPAARPEHVPQPRKPDAAAQRTRH